MSYIKVDTYSRLEKLIAKTLINNSNSSIQSTKGHKSINEQSKKITNLLRLTSYLLIIISFISGTAVAAVLFQYDGLAPINVLPILTFFVFMPLLFLVVTLIISIFTKDDNRGLAALLFSWFQNRVETIILKRSVDDLYESKKLENGEFSRVYQELVLLFFKSSFQKCMSFYVIGALIWMILNVTTTDLTFSWSSTLEFGGENVFAITSIMSKPWAWFAPSANIDLQTVQSTRFYRANLSNISDVSSGRWWSFLFMSIIFYSLIPRIILFFCYKFRLNKFLKNALKSSSDVPNQIKHFQTCSKVLYSNALHESKKEKPIHEFHNFENAYAHFEGNTDAWDGMWYIFVGSDGTRIGKTIREIRSADNPKEFFKSLWNTEYHN